METIERGKIIEIPESWSVALSIMPWALKKLGGITDDSELLLGATNIVCVRRSVEKMVLPKFDKSPVATDIADFKLRGMYIYNGKYGHYDTAIYMCRRHIENLKGLIKPPFPWIPYAVEPSIGDGKGEWQKGFLTKTICLNEATHLFKLLEDWQFSKGFKPMDLSLATSPNKSDWLPTLKWREQYDR